MSENLTPEAVAETLDVSRETLERLETYVGLLRKWQRAINLIGPSTTGDIWRRHILDAGQLLKLVPHSSGPLLDLGSGAGLPGLVLAIMGAEDVRLAEADSRKCAFMREAARVTGTPATIHELRIETLQPVAARAITARALAPLSRLLDLCEPHITPNTICLFLKGKRVQSEIEDIESIWRSRVDLLPSLSSPEGVIVRMESLHRVDAHRC